MPSLADACAEVVEIETDRLRDRIGTFVARQDTSETLVRFKRWFSRPPRPHGEIIPDRTVSFLELFYDLVYVAIIAQATHHLAEHISIRGLGEFAVIFALIWFAWLNGSLYLELHGREDGRTRMFVFLQMGILALLAVFTANAAGDSGQAFAIVYAAFLVIMTWLWYTVLRQDHRERPERTQILVEAGRYVTGMVVSAAAILLSAFLPAELRLVVWAGFAIGWVVALWLIGRPSAFDGALVPTHSLIERFGLFIIVALGEVVVGVVNGLSVAERDVKTVATGMIALVLGFGFWWIYFDLVGRRLPRGDGLTLMTWIVSHLPFTLSVAAAGAAMVSLIDHAHDASTPADTAWLLAGAVALGLFALILIERMLVDAQRLFLVYGPLTIVLAGGAAAALVAGWARPAPWLLALLLVAILTAVWFFAVSRFLRADAWGET